jgi:hypothetical protein
MGAVTADSLTVDTSTLVVDSTNNRVGIGTTSPSEDLHISGDTSVALIEGTNNATSGLVAGVRVKAQFYRRAGFSILDESDNEDFFIGRPYASTNQFVITNDGTERLRINTSGNIGIGTSSPNTNLHVYDASGGATLKIESNTANAYDSSKIQLLGGNLSTSEILLGDASSATTGRIIYRHDGNSLAFDVNGSEAARFDSLGNFGIGTTSPDAPLTVHSSSDPEIRLGYSSSQDHRIAWDSAKLFLDADPDNQNNNSILGFRVDGSEAGRFDASGNLLVGVTSTTLTGGSLTLPNSGIVAFHDAAGNARNALQFVSGQLKHGAAGAGLTSQTFHTSNVEAMRIDSSQRVGIGTTSPASNLHIKTSVDNSVAQGLVVERSANSDRGYI